MDDANSLAEQNRISKIKKKSFLLGCVVGLVIVILINAGGALYIWYYKAEIIDRTLNSTITRLVEKPSHRCLEVS